jgi:hypothetical protein
MRRAPPAATPATRTDQSPVARAALVRARPRTFLTVPPISAFPRPLSFSTDYSYLTEDTPPRRVSDVNEPAPGYVAESPSILCGVRIHVGVIEFIADAQRTGAFSFLRTRRPPDSSRPTAIPYFRVCRQLHSLLIPVSLIFPMHDSPMLRPSIYASSF